MTLTYPNDKFINLLFKESKKSRYVGNKLKNDLGNCGCELGSRYFVDRNGEYTGIVIQLEQKVYPLYLTNSVHQIYLNIEYWYTNNIVLINKFNLVNLYQKYSNQIFRFIVDEFLLTNNLEPFYTDYPELIKQESLDKELEELKKKIKYDYHELIPVPIQVISCGSLLPANWMGRKFDCAKSFHQSIDKLDERIGKPPVTYLANYSMCELKINKPDTYSIDWIEKNILKNKNKLVFVLDEKLKFIQDYIYGEFKYIKKNTNYTLINIELVGYPEIIIIFEPEKIMREHLEAKQTSLGFNVSLLQKSIRRGIGSQVCLEEAVETLINSKPFNNPEYSYQMVSGIRQLCWRSFITIIEETKSYTSSKYLDLFDFSIYSYIFSTYPNYYCSSELGNKIKQTCFAVQKYKNYWDFSPWVTKKNNEPDKLLTGIKLNTNKLLSLGIKIGLDKMPGMRGDKIMLDSTIKWLKANPQLPNLDLVENEEKNHDENNFLNSLENKITWLNSIDQHCNPSIISSLHNGLYGFDLLIINKFFNTNNLSNLTLEDISGIIWELNSKYNFRKHNINWLWINNLILLLQYFTSKTKSKIIDFNINKLYFEKIYVVKSKQNYKNLILLEAEQNLQTNLLDLEFEKEIWEWEFRKLSNKLKKTQIENKIQLYRIGQMILSNQNSNYFWFKGKKTIPIYTNDQIKFKIGDIIYDIEGLDGLDGNNNKPDSKSSINFLQIFKYFMSNYKVKIKLNSKILINKEFNVEIIQQKILINGLECIQINDDKKILWINNLNNFLVPENIYKSVILSDSSIHKKLINLVSQSNPNPIKKYILYKSLELVDIKSITNIKNFILESDILKYIPIDIIKNLIGRIGTSIEDKNDQVILILGKVDRMGKSTTDAIDSLNEGYLIRIINVLSKLYGCFEKINETKFIIHTNSKIYKYWLEKVELICNSNSNKNSQLPISDKKISRVVNTKINNLTNSFIKTELWEHQKRIKNMIIGGIEKYVQKGWGDASNVGSGKTLTGLAVIDGINNIIINKQINNLEQNYLILVPNTNLFVVWENEIKSHCDSTKINYFIQNSNGKWELKFYKQDSEKKRINLYISTMGRNRDNPINKPIEFVIIDECLTVQNNNTKWTIKAFEQVVKSKYGVLMLSATFFRTRFDKLFFMLKMLQIELPTKQDYLDTILNIAIGANIKITNKQWNTTVHQIELDKEFYDGYEKSKKTNKKESYIELKKYMSINIDWETIIIDKVNKLISEGRKPIVFVESESQLERLSSRLNQIKIKSWSFYPDITQDVCVISKHKGTYGINNLVKYDTLLLKPPEPDKLPQIKGRLDRPGQNSSKLYIEYITIANTIDQIDLVSLEIANNFYSSHIIPLANYYDKYA